MTPLLSAARAQPGSATVALWRRGSVAARGGAAVIRTGKRDLSASVAAVLQEHAHAQKPVGAERLHGIFWRAELEQLDGTFGNAGSPMICTGTELACSPAMWMSAIFTGPQL